MVNRAVVLDSQGVRLGITGAARELALGLGLSDSRLEGSGDRTDRWDLMSTFGPHVISWAYYSEDDDPTYYRPCFRYYSSDELPFGDVGPGLNAAADMQALGALDPDRVARPGDAETVTLRPLHRADLPGHLAAVFDDTFIEFRVNDRWDTEIPRSCVLLHRLTVSPTDGTTRSELLRVRGPGSTDAELLEGDRFELGNMYDIFSPHLVIEVVDISTVELTATVRLSYAEGRQPPSKDTYGGVSVGGGGLVWTPGKGFKKVPPDSPLREILDHVADLADEYGAEPRLDSSEITARWTAIEQIAQRGR